VLVNLSAGCSCLLVVTIFIAILSGFKSDTIDLIILPALFSSCWFTLRASWTSGNDFSFACKNFVGSKP